MSEKTIWKFQLAVTGVQKLSMPKGAKLLSVQVQNGLPQLWALVDPKAPKEQQVFVTFGTGQPNVDADALSFLGTYQLDDGALVFHVFHKGK